ncbi:2-dehydropantoate 2-reductase family protein [Aspergillus luchuensis]|uniref:2-dehydropantoate 2-reductase family protein n=1 Tax=Aspergillus kawachii TaxID=1069201 RepID=A0A146FXL8_ASPKA|nr:2-dehydropantoate 2-reductase family protein [Aspergillus luchuensis]
MAIVMIRGASTPEPSAHRSSLKKYAESKGLEDEVGDAAAAGRRPPPSDAGTSRGSCFQSRADQKIQACIHHCGHNLTEIIDILLSVDPVGLQGAPLQELAKWALHK